MPRVEFYVLPDTDPRQRLKVACQLAGKAWRAGLTVFIRGADEADCEALDNLLWSYRSASIIPHNRHEDGADAPVVIGVDQQPAHAQGLLINLHPDLPADPERYSRVIEIVNQAPELLTICREHFRQYRQRGYAPQRVEL